MLDLFGEVDIDLEEVTMADLCKPTLRIGKVSTNFELVREAEQQLKQKRLKGEETGNWLGLKEYHSKMLYKRMKSRDEEMVMM